MSEQTVSWEDRVVALELEAKQERDRRAAVERTVAERDATITSLKAMVEEGAAREKARRKAEVDGYIGGLKAKAAEKGLGIPEHKLAHVAQAFEAGMDDLARSFGESLVANALSVSTEGEIVSPSRGGDDQSATNNYIAANLRANGWKVEQDAKGNIVSKTPPQKAGR